MTYRETLEAAANKPKPPLNAEQLRKRNERAAKIQAKIADERRRSAQRLQDLQSDLP